MIRPYVTKQLKLLVPHLTDMRSILDYGCGDLSLAKGLKETLPAVSIQGIDVVDSGVRARGIPFTLYDGKKLPFKNGSFDAAVVYHVFHHCDDPAASLQDVMRVTKKTILIIEPVFRTAIDLFFMKILDRLGNGWRGVTIPMPFMFQREATWTRWFTSAGWMVASVQPAGVLPGWLPFGETKLFVLRRPTGRGKETYEGG